MFRNDTTYHQQRAFGCRKNEPHLGRERHGDTGELQRTCTTAVRTVRRSLEKIAFLFGSNAVFKGSAGTVNLVFLLRDGAEVTNKTGDCRRQAGPGMMPTVLYLPATARHFSTVV